MIGVTPTILFFFGLSRRTARKDTYGHVGLRLYVVHSCSTKSVSSFVGMEALNTQTGSPTNRKNPKRTVVCLTVSHTNINRDDLCSAFGNDNEDNGDNDTGNVAAIDVSLSTDASQHFGVSPCSSTFPKGNALGVCFLCCTRSVLPADPTERPCIVLFLVAAIGS